MGSQGSGRDERPSGLPPKPSWLEAIRRRVRPWLPVLTLAVLAAQAALLAVQLGLMYWQASIMDAQEKFMGQQTNIMQEQKDTSKKQTEIAEPQTKLVEYTLQAQVEPVVDFFIEETSGYSREFALLHDGAFKVLAVSVDREWAWFDEPLFDPHEVKKWPNTLHPRTQKPDFEEINPGERRPIEAEKMGKILRDVLAEAREQHQQQRAIGCFRVT